MRTVDPLRDLPALAPLFLFSGFLWQNYLGFMLRKERVEMRVTSGLGFQTDMGVTSLPCCRFSCLKGQEHFLLHPPPTSLQIIL